MKKQIVTLIFLAAAQLSSNNVFAQPFTSQANVRNYDTSCISTDWYINAVANPTYARFGILNRGTWGGGTTGDQYIVLGPNDLATNTTSTYNAPANNRLYGMSATMDADRMFVGLRSRSNVAGCNKNYLQNNAADGVIAWGNDNGASGQGIDRLIFEYHHHIRTTPPLEIATMLPNGNVGIGTPSPSHQLHVMQGVRFEGLPSTTFNSSQHEVIVKDVNGVLYRTSLSFPPGSLVNNCPVTDYVTKTDPSGNLVCSQIYDDGTSVGIGTNTGFAGSFTYALGGGYGTLLGTMASTPSTGTVTLDVNGVSRSLAHLAYSDRSLKTNIREVSNAMQIISKLNAKTYDWNEKAKTQFHADNGRHIGFIAQELAEVLPEIVVKDKNNTYAVNYTELIPILAEGIKEQQKTIDQLRAEVIAMKNATNVSDVAGASFKIYPNPTSEAVTIELDDMSTGNVLITDLNGRMVKKIATAEFSGNSYKLAKGVLAPGIYLVTLTNDATPGQTQRLVVTE